MINPEQFEKKVQKSVDIIRGRGLISRLLVGLSGGKDSLCLCELIKMAEVTDVKYFNMEFLPDLRIHYDLLQYACMRFNIPYEQIIKVPAETFYKYMHYSCFTWYSDQAQKDFPKLLRADIYKALAREYKGTVVTGVKKSDSLIMTRKIERNACSELFPMADWTLEEVFTFMKLRNIEVPPLTKKGCRAVGLADQNIMFIYENYPDDFEKIEKVFPFIRASILKYKYFNIEQKLRLA